MSSLEFPVLTDTHCHINLEKFSPDREAVLERAWQAGIRRILVPGLDITSSQSIVDLVAGNQALFAAVGIHPTEARESSEEDLPGLANLTRSPKVKAIGEIGLDYYWNTSPHELQKAVLGSQLDLATEMGLPVVLHFREKGDLQDGPCASDLLVMLELWVNHLHRTGNPLASHPGVLHSFSGSIISALKAVELGFCLGVTGPVTYNPFRQEMVSAIPLKRILLETDAPFLAPVPHRGKRNEPANVRLIADKIALLHSCSLEQCAAVTASNASELFNWED